MKKMKKRRELDALVNGKLGRRKKGQHELLRNDSDSSEVEEFSIPEKTVLRKGSSCHFCATCMTVCGFFLLAACVAAIGGLVWVHIEMKKEVDQLRLQLGQVQLTPMKGLEQVSQNQRNLEKQLNDMKNKDLVNIQTSISKLNTQMLQVNTTIARLQKVQSEDTRPQIDNKELVQNIATFGSKLATLEQEVSNLKNIQTTVDQDHDKIQKIDKLAEDIDALNLTTSSRFHEHVFAIRKLKNKTDSLDVRFDLMDVHQVVSPVPDIESLVQDAIHNSLQNLTQEQGFTNAEAVQHLQHIVIRLQEQVDSINETLTFVKNEIQQEKKDLKDDGIMPYTDTQLGDYAQFRNKTITQLQIIKGSLGALSKQVNDHEYSAEEDDRTTPDAADNNHEAMSNTDKATYNTDDVMNNNGQMNTKLDLSSDVQSSQGQRTTTQIADVELLHIDDISHEEDIARLLMSDSNVDGKVSYNELGAAFPDAHIDRDLFLSFDDDHDMNLGKEELISAFGLTNSDSSESVTNEDNKDPNSKKRMKRRIWDMYRNL